MINKHRKLAHSTGMVSIILVLFINYLVVFLPHLLTSTLWMAPRTIIGIFHFISSIYMIILLFPLSKRYERFISIILSIFLVINIMQISNIGINVFSSNKIDKEIIQVISNKILKYENANDLKVKKIAIAKDAEPQYGYYDNVNYIRFDTNIRALAVDWAIIPAINFYCNKEYTSIAMPVEIYNKYFLGKNWDFFDQDEQLLFIGDTLYLISY
jgi:hypothetical protein